MPPPEAARRKRWGLIQVESALACNLYCMMCPWKEISRQVATNGYMTEETWESIRPYLPEAQAVDFTGGGEPLLQPSLVEWVRQAHQAGCQTGMLTNGVLLKKETSQGLMDPSFSRRKHIEAAAAAMPDAPSGCEICHYLYNV